MAFVWSRKFAKPVQLQAPVAVQEETLQVVTVPEYDKISVEEHKDGECVVSSCKEDNEANEVQGDICQGQGVGSSDQGSQEDVAQCEELNKDDEGEEESSQPLIEETATE